MNRNRSLMQVSRRDFLKLAGVRATSVALSNFLADCAPAAGAPATLNVLVPAAPDPAPPGVAKFSEEAFAQWKKENNAEVVYEAPPWPQLHDKMAANFASGQYVHDIMYNCGWVPEFADYLVDLVDQLPADLVADLPASSFSTVTWNGKRLGVIFTLSLLTMFYNTEHLEKAGLKEPATGAKIVLEPTCVGCKVCTIACPFGTINYVAQTGKVQKCDLCGGAPACVKACPPGAITYVDADWTGLGKMRQWAGKTDTNAAAV